MEIKCLSCGKEVDVKLVRYGNGHIASCPLCGKLAYSASKKVDCDNNSKKEEITFVKILGSS